MKTAADMRAFMVRHALRRLFERKGFALGIPEYEAVCAIVSRGGAALVGKGYGGRTFHQVEVRGTSLFACWDTEHQCIVTFVPQMRASVLQVVRAA